MVVADRPVGIGGGGRCPLTQLFDENVRLNLLVIYVHVRTYLLVILYLLHTRRNHAPTRKSKHATVRRDFFLSSLSGEYRGIPNGTRLDVREAHIRSRESELSGVLTRTAGARNELIISSGNR